VVNKLASAHFKPLHPLHAIILAFPFPLFLGALISDFAYWSTFQIQWANFSAWLIAGGMLAGTLVAPWALIEMLRLRRARSRRPTIYFFLLLSMWMLGILSALVHAKDAWATMPEGLFLSAATALVALIAAWIGYSGFRPVEVT
jgi:uncharacterized membrane protein